MKLTVHKLAELAGITVRTLHHYDQIGLLKPSSVGNNGYRYYSQEEVEKLQQIMFFSELDFSLSEIKKMISASDYDAIEALKNQKLLLKIKHNKLLKLMKTVDKTIKSINSQNLKVDKALFDSFSDFEMNRYKDETKKRWGHTDAYRQSVERTKNWTKEDYKKIAEDGARFTQILADSADLPVTHTEVQKLIAEHYRGINVFYDCSLEMYRGLSQMYIDDPRFAAYYEKFRPGLAKFVSEAIKVFCDSRS